ICLNAYGELDATGAERLGIAAQGVARRERGLARTSSPRVARHRRRADFATERCAVPCTESGGLVALVLAARTPHPGTLRREDSTMATTGGVNRHGRRTPGTNRA